MIPANYFETVLNKIADRAMAQRQLNRVLSAVTAEWQLPETIAVSLGNVNAMQVGHMLLKLGGKVQSRKVTGTGQRQWRARG